VKLRTIVLQSKLRLATLATKLRVAIGDFISAVLPADTTVVSDAISKQTGKNKLDGLLFTDTMVFIPTKRPSETVTITDTTAAYFAEDYVTGAPTAQTYTLGTPQFFWTLTKLLQDTPTVSDQITKTLPTKVLAETVNATDDVNGAAAGDDQIMQYFKVTTNIASVSDGTITRSISSTKSDSARAASAGSLSIQDYTVDMSYFLEDYVGTGRSWSY
jgi:hypothetical protein